jgi:thiol-disulfide isomerase/thioredoxin
MRRLATLLMSIAVLISVCSCASFIGIADESQTSPGLHALEFSAKTLDGKYFSGQDLTGKPAVLWFWAPWCPTCQGEAPSVAKAVQTHPAVTFVGVAARDQVPAMKQFVAKYQMAGYTQLADLDGSVWRHFGITQ